MRQENLELERYRDAAIALRNENERLRSLLSLKTDPPIPMVAGQVVLDARGPFSNTRLADVGTEKGVAIGSPVMSEHGLVGRVVGVSRGASRILLITDIASRIPVMVDRTNARAILTGEGGPNPKLAYMRGINPVRAGDRILTSGDGGVFPRGLPVGVAVMGLDGNWRVRLDSDFAAIDFVRILLFKDFQQLVDQHALARTSIPPLPSGQAEAIKLLEQPRPKPSPAPPASVVPGQPVLTPAPQAQQAASIPTKAITGGKAGAAKPGAAKHRPAKAPPAPKPAAARSSPGATP